MDRLTQVALNSMRLMTENQKITTSNLANSSSIGFQRDMSDNLGSVYLKSQNSLEDRVFGTRGENGIDTSRGQMIPTDNNLDVAVEGQGYLVAQAPNGDQTLTRRGDMKVGLDGFLRNGDGNLIIGGGGPINIPPYKKIEVGSDGTISILPLGDEGTILTPVGRLQLVSTTAQNLSRGLDSFIRPKDGQIPQPDANIKLNSKVLESSNVNTVDTLVSLVEHSRSYDMKVKLLSTAKEIDTETSKLMRNDR